MILIFHHFKGKWSKKFVSEVANAGELTGKYSLNEKQFPFINRFVIQRNNKISCQNL
jgi:hypothetical protein